MKRSKTVKKRFYALRCHNGLYAVYPAVGDGRRPFRLEAHTLCEDTITRYPWFWTACREQAERYCDENNAMIDERCAGFTLEVVKIEMALKITPGEIEFNRPKTRKMRRKEAIHD